MKLRELFGSEVKKELRRKTKGAARKAVQVPARKASAYQKQLGIEMRKLKKKHPKTPMSKLMKRAHIAARKKKRKRK